jgi:hypothetical protein
MMMISLFRRVSPVCLLAEIVRSELESESEKNDEER